MRRWLLRRCHLLGPCLLALSAAAIAHASSSDAILSASVSGAISESPAFFDDELDLVDGSAGGQRDLPRFSIALACLWFFPVICYWYADRITRRWHRRVFKGEVSDNFTPAAPFSVSLRDAEYVSQSETVLCASLEHSLPHLPQAKAVAGGLGKVMDLVSKHHPTNLIMVHPMIEESDTVSYGPMKDYQEEPALRLLVDGRHHQVKVYRQSTYPQGKHGPRVDFVLLANPMFQARAKESIYPGPMSRRAVLVFFSLWNQAVGALLVRYRPSIFHCPDFHSAVAPWYALPFHFKLKILLVLHNAEYQGTIATDMIKGNILLTMAKIWNLPAEKVARHLVLNGRFNMLKAAVDFCMEVQGGEGVCAVSQYYAHEARFVHTVLWNLPGIHGLDNPMLEEERAQLTGTLERMKQTAKAETQQELNLKVDPSAKIFVSLGRLVRQKGVDLLADVAPWLLLNFPKAQFILIGPIGDGYGHYAASKLRRLMQDQRFRGRVFVRTEFMRVSDSLKFAADFCLMPSRDEPFGYVDVEFAWRGAVVVGCQVGGLGKVPGFYFLPQNRDNPDRVRLELRAVIAEAMNASPSTLLDMSQAALECTFELEEWQKKLKALYWRLIKQEREGLLSDEQQDGSELSTLEHQGDTFMGGESRRPSLMPLPTKNCALSPLGSLDVQSVDMVNAMMSVQRNSLAGGIEKLAIKKEFLVQELSEEETSQAVQKRLVMGHFEGIDSIIEDVGDEVTMDRTEGEIGRWLVRKTLGVCHIHWCVSCGYIFTPVAGFLTTVITTEWTTRGGLDIPDYVTEFAWYKVVFRQGTPPAELLIVCLFSINCLATALGTPVWGFLSSFVAPRKLLATSLLMQLPICLMLSPMKPSVVLAAAVVAYQGFVSSGGLLYISFNFMLSIKGDLAESALIVGCLEMLRYCITWLFAGYIYICSPSAFKGGTEELMPEAVIAILIPMAIVIFFATAVPGVLICFAEGPYKSDLSPGWDLGLIFKKNSFLLFCLSDVIGALATYPAVIYMQWFVANGWSTYELGWICLLFGIVLCLGTGLWYKVLATSLRSSMKLLIGTAVLLAPAGLLRGLVFEEVSTHTFWRSSYVALAIGLFSILVEGIRSSAMWTLKIRVLGSRWRLLSYATIFNTLTLLATGASPWICEWNARNYGISFISTNQKELADAMIVCLAPVGIMQFAFQVTALPIINRDLGVQTQEKRGLKLCSRLWQRVPLLIAVVTAMGLGYSVNNIMSDFLHREMAFAPVHKCSNKRTPTCRSVYNKFDPRQPDRVGNGFSAGYGINKYGFSTTGKFNCLSTLRGLPEGNTMVFWESGRCEIQVCDDSSDLAHIGEDGLTDTPVEVWSKLCGMSGQNRAGVQLMEWRWEDVGEECRTYLGPAGFDFVQVSPAQEHALGSHWWTRYRPVSFKLESRSGTMEQFVKMVQDCKRAGVDVMVDVVLNHMANDEILAPEWRRGWKCSSEEDPANQKTAEKCRGWAGTFYNWRDFSHTYFSDSLIATPNAFHHIPTSLDRNCDVPPWANNRYLCDLFSLPDWDTESPHVQRAMIGFIMDLFHFGVSNLRIDAASHIYPSSLATILEPFPLDYTVQEIYPNILEKETRTKHKAELIGSMTDFLYGSRLAQMFFDGYSKENGTFFSRLDVFPQALTFDEQWNSGPQASEHGKECPYPAPCYTSASKAKAMVFLDNHDTQRARARFNEDYRSVCFWDGTSINECRPTFHQGLDYRLAQLYMLTYPYGDAVKVMSSFSFLADTEKGPPGTRLDSIDDQATRVFQRDEDGNLTSRCKDVPTTAPATAEWINRTGWVCEHRWPGVAGAMHFRKLSGGAQAEAKPRYWDQEGHATFNVGREGFVAMSRQGYNWVVGLGSDAPWDLRYQCTGLPTGVYCDMAKMSAHQLDFHRQALGWSCDADQIVGIGQDGCFRSTYLLEGKSMVILHLGHSMDRVVQACQKRCKFIQTCIRKCIGVQRPGGSDGEVPRVVV